MRYGSPLAILVLAVVLGVGVFARWAVMLHRLARDYERMGEHRKADLLRSQVRTQWIGGGGTLLFVAVLWVAILHDLGGRQ